MLMMFFPTKRWWQIFYGYVYVRKWFSTTLFFDEWLNHSKATSWESSADYMASWRPAVDLEAAASAADEESFKTSRVMSSSL